MEAVLRRARSGRGWEWRSNGLVRVLLRLYPLAVVLAVWQLVAVYGNMGPLLFPRLELIGREMVRLARTGEVFPHLGYTVFRAFSGFLLALAVGVLLGFALYRFRLFRFLFEPVFSITYPIPRISLYPIFVLLFGLKHLSKISLVALECLYPITVNTYNGARSVNRTYIWAARNMGASELQVLYKVVVPASIPYICAGMRIALPIALVVTVLTEMIGSGDGIGFLIAYSAASLNKARMFASLIYAGVVGYAFDRLVVSLEKRMGFWKDGEHPQV